MSYVARELTSREYWEAIKATGWVDALPLADHEALRLAVERAHGESPEYAAYALAATAFDMECIEGTGPDDPCSYHSVISQLGEDSRGCFRPESIVDRIDEEEGQVTITFVMDGSQYGCVVPLDEDWFDPRVIDLINEAMADCGEAVQFFPLPFSDQIARLVLVAPEVWERAMEDGVIPPQDYFFG